MLVLKRLIRKILPQAIKSVGIPRKICGEWIILPFEVVRYFPAKYEPEKFRFISEYAFGTGLDLGAHVGLFTVELSKKCKKVVAFEPTTDTRKILSRTLFLNGCQNVEIREEIVGDVNTDIDFYITDDVASCLNSTAPIGRLVRKKSVTIDSLNLQVDYIKMDIEGSEFKALSGALHTLRQVRYMSLEVHPKLLKMQGDSPDDIFNLLSDFSPTYFLDGKAVKVESLRLLEEIFEINVKLNLAS